MRSVAALLDEHFSLYYPIVHDPDQANRITIHRNHIWKDAVRAMSHSSFDPSCCVWVTFIGNKRWMMEGLAESFFIGTEGNGRRWHHLPRATM